MYKIKHTFAALLVVVVVAFVALTMATAASADPTSTPSPTPVPGEPSCPGLDTASFAQDWKNFGFEPSGVGGLTRFYGGTPTDFTQSGRYDDCSA
jgi:hypothetical protein